MASSSRVFIGTLYSGESEFDECKRLVELQKHPNITHESIENLPNREAHEALYARFMALSHDFDYFIKLDADMWLASENVVSQLVVGLLSLVFFHVLSVPCILPLYLQYPLQSNAKEGWAFDQDHCWSHALQCCHFSRRLVCI